MNDSSMSNDYQTKAPERLSWNLQALWGPSLESLLLQVDIHQLPGRSKASRNELKAISIQI